ncbi:hypothetical protein V8G57_09665 [Collimonas sp. H4R21]|uniref:Lipoprotein n=1 Tax=Collimonas rhizosphaerae TaxID=3126357 RepID=A0ABU9PUI8_9BURK
MNRMLYKTTLSLFCIVSTLMLVGCAFPPKLPLDQTAVKNVKKVALIPIRESQSITVMDSSIGPLFPNSWNIRDSEAYAAAINAQNVKMADTLRDTLLVGFQKKGLDVVVLTDQYPKWSADGKSYDYSDIKTDADVILQVWFGYTGYFSGAFKDYQPWLMVHSVLLDAHTKMALYRQSFSAGMKPIVDSIEFIPIEGQIKYISSNQLMLRFKESFDQLLQGHQAIARQLMLELKLGAGVCGTDVPQGSCNEQITSN